MPAHIRIRILLLLAVAVICGGVFVVTELQRRSDKVSFEEYAAVRELRAAGMQMVIVLDEAITHGPEARKEVRAAQRAVAEKIVDVQSRPDAGEGAERELVDRQARAATGLADLSDDVLAGAPPARVDAARDRLLARFLAANDELLDELGAEREAVRRSAARRPVILVLALFIFFAALHLLVVERPANRERRGRRGQHEFAEAMQVARSEPEAYDVLARHVERVSGAGQVTVLNRNNSADRLAPATLLARDSTIAQGLEGATPDSCLAVRLARTQHRAPGDERLLTCEVCGRSAGQTTCVPSLVGGEVVGAVLIEHRGALAGERRRMIEQSVAEAAPVVANLRNLAIAELRAATDGLTGLPNQRAVHEAVKRAAALAARTASPLALVLFDLDRFKTINDSYGHGKGDDVLAAVGAVAAETLRASDFVGRLAARSSQPCCRSARRHQGGGEAAQRDRRHLRTRHRPARHGIVRGRGPARPRRRARASAPRS